MTESKGLYAKTGNGEFKNVTFKSIITKDWNDKLILVKIDTDDGETIDDVLSSLNDADALSNLSNASFLITLRGIHFTAIDQQKAKELIVKLQEYVDKGKV